MYVHSIKKIFYLTDSKIKKLVDRGNISGIVVELVGHKQKIQYIIRCQLIVLIPYSQK